MGNGSKLDEPGAARYAVYSIFRVGQSVSSIRRGYRFVGGGGAIIPCRSEKWCP